MKNEGKYIVLRHTLFSYRHVGEEWDSRDGGAELLVLVELREGLREDAVRASLDVLLGAVNRLAHALHGQRVGAGHDEEVGVAAGVHGGGDARNHLAGGDNLLSLLCV